MNKRLYVENLPASATERSVRELFSQTGPVTEVQLMLDPATGRSRGRAFVTMATPELAQAALKSLHQHSLDGRNIAVTEARPVEERSTTGLIGHGFEAGIGNNTIRAEKSRPPKKAARRRNHGQRRGR